MDNRNKLYNTIVKGISKSLRESLFDDTDDILLTNDSIINTELMDNKFIELINNTIGKTSFANTKGQKIFQDPNNKVKYYTGLLPYSTKYSIKHIEKNCQKFYNYSIEFLDNGTICLNIINIIEPDYNKKIWVIKEELYNFISLSPINISHILFYYLNTITEYPYELVYINNKENISNKFIYNFPNIINIKKTNKKPTYENISFLNSIYFSSKLLYIKLVKKLVNNGFNIKDENNIIYTKENINQYEKDILNNNYDNIIDNKIKKKELIIKDIVGEDIINKYNKIVTYFNNNNKNFYLKSINTLRKTKISLENTILPLIKENGYYDILLKKYKQNDILNIFFFNMLKNMKDKGLNSYKINLSKEDCLMGILTEYGIKKVDMNMIPIIFRSVSNLYNLYYAIAYTISNKNNIREFNFDILTELLLTIMENFIKKYKL